MPGANDFLSVIGETRDKRKIGFEAPSSAPRFQITPLARTKRLKMLRSCTCSSPTWGLIPVSRPKDVPKSNLRARRKSSEVPFRN